MDDLIDFTPELHAEAVKLASKYKLGPMFTPPVVSRIDGPLATLSRAQAGTNWAGGSYDPETHRVYVFSTGAIGAYGLVPPADAAMSDMEYVQGSATSGARRTGGAGSAAGGGRTGDAAGGEGGG